MLRADDALAQRQQRPCPWSCCAALCLDVSSCNHISTCTSGEGQVLRVDDTPGRGQRRPSPWSRCAAPCPGHAPPQAAGCDASAHASQPRRSSRWPVRRGHVEFQNNLILMVLRQASNHGDQARMPRYHRTHHEPTDQPEHMSCHAAKQLPQLRMHVQHEIHRRLSHSQTHLVWQEAIRDVLAAHLGGRHERLIRVPQLVVRLVPLAQALGSAEHSTVSTQT